MPHVAVLTRDYPMQGGRMSLVKNLLTSPITSDFSFTIISSETAKGIGTEENVLYQTVRHQKGVFRLIEYYLRSYHTLSELHRMRKIDLILATGLSSLGGILFSKMHRIPCVHNLSGFKIADKPHRSRTVSSTARERPEKKKSFIVRNIERANTAANIFFEILNVISAPNITVPTPYARTKITRYLPWTKRKIRVFLEGIDTKRIRPINKDPIRRKLGLKKEDRVVLFARIEEREIFEEVLRLLQTEMPALKIIIIENRYFEYIPSLKTAKRKRVDLIINEAFNVGDICIFLPETEAHSSTGMEALHLGLPIIAKNVDWFKHELKDAPLFLIHSLSAESIVEKLKDFYKNKRRYTEQAKALNDRLSKKYDADGCIQSYRDLFSYLIRASD